MIRLMGSLPVKHLDALRPMARPFLPGKDDLDDMG